MCSITPSSPAGCQRTQVADDAVALLAARVAGAAFAVGRLDDDMAAMRGHHAAEVERCELAQRFSESTLAAQMKSLSEMPFTECVLKRSVQRL